MICNGVLGLCPGTSEASTKTMSISIHTVKTDVKGRYVILVVKVMNRFLPFVNLYVAPAFSLSYLDDMLQATYEIAKGKIFILEDLMQWWTQLLIGSSSPGGMVFYIWVPGCLAFLTSGR